ncbi:putative phage tail protein [Streptococcus parasuis]|uniref:putative phage tail protein n=1 Tax=Streptococcus parasuis TaxID=1501662 RepID=UPI00370D1972
MIRDVNLIEHLPLFIQQFREIKSIMDAENPEFQLVIDESEKIKNNQFIETSDLVGISKFEKLLNIVPLADDTLESRISRIMTRWNDVVPYTYKALVQKLVQLCNGLNFTIDKNFNEYKMEIITHLELSGQVDDLQYLLGYMIPVNIELTSKNDIYCNSYGQSYIAAGSAHCKIINLSDAYKENYDVQGTSIIASGTATSENFGLSDSYKEEYSLQGNSNIGGAYLGTVEVTISDNFNETVNIGGKNEVGSNASVTQITGIN